MSSYVRPDSLSYGRNRLETSGSVLDSGGGSDAENFLPSLNSASPKTSVELLFSLFVSLAAAVHTSTGVQQSNIIENIANQDIGIINIHTKYIGSGSTFRVREFRDDVSGKSLALKSAMTLDKRLSALEERHRLTSVILELRALTFLSGSDSRNVVRLLAVSWETDIFDRQRKWPVPVLELGDGGTLIEFLQEQKVDFNTRLRLCLDAATGLATLHRCGIIHGDMKPANLLVFQEAHQDSGDGWTVKLTDFGGAVLDVENHGFGTLRTPTPPWNAPEGSERLDTKGLLSTDVYSLGLVFASIFCHCSNFFKLISLEPAQETEPPEQHTQLGRIQHLKQKNLGFQKALLRALSAEESVSDEEAAVIQGLLSLTVQLEPEQRSLAGVIERLETLVNISGQYKAPRIAGSLTRRLKDVMAGPSELEVLTPEVRFYARLRLEYTALRGLDSEMRATAALTLAIDSLGNADEEGLQGKSCAKWLALAAELGDTLAQSLIFRFHNALGEPLPLVLEEKVKAWLRSSALQGHVAAQQDYAAVADEDELRSSKNIYRTVYGGIGWDRFSSWTAPLSASLSQPRESSSLSASFQDPTIAIEDIKDGNDTILHAAASIGDLATLSVLIGRQPTIVNLTAAHGETALLLGCRSGHAAVVEFLLEHGADPRITDENRDGPLHWIISFEESVMQEIASKLCEYGADPNIRARRWKVPRDPDVFFEQGTPLHRAVQRGSLAAIKVLLQRGAKCAEHAWESNGWTPMHLAAYLHYPEILETLLDNVPGSLPARHIFGQSSLLIPAIKGSIERGPVFDKIARHGREWWPRQERCLDILLRRGAEAHLHQMPSGSIGNGATALFIAVGLSHPAAAQYLLLHGAQSDIETACALEEGHTLSTPLHRSITHWNKESFMLLLLHGANPQAKHIDENGREQTYVYECALSGHADTSIASQLLARGVQVDEAPPGYETAFACAVRKRCFTFAAYLLQQGANLCPEFSAGVMFELERPLFLHAILIMEQSINSLSCIDFLLEQTVEDRNIFLYTSSRQEETVFHQIAKTPEYGRDDTACRLLTLKLLEYLEPSSEHINAVTNGGYSALALAAHMGNLAVATILLENDADPMAGKSELQSALALLQLRVSASRTLKSEKDLDMLRLFRNKLGEERWVNFVISNG